MTQVDTRPKFTRAFPRPEPRLTSAQAAAFLNERGYPISKRYFRKLCAPGNGSGPPSDGKFGCCRLYRTEDLLAWAEARVQASKAT